MINKDNFNLCSHCNGTSSNTDFVPSTKKLTAILLKCEHVHSGNGFAGPCTNAVIELRHVLHLHCHVLQRNTCLKRNVQVMTIQHRPLASLIFSVLLQGEFQLSKFQDGVLPAAFMVGLLVASLIFSELCKHYNAFRLIGKLPSQHLNAKGIFQHH